MAENERDTHFAGFGEMLYGDLFNLFRSLFYDCVTAEQAYHMQEDIQTYIAQRAYDLVERIVSDAPVTEWEWDMRDIPDMTEWPEQKASEG